MSSLSTLQQFKMCETQYCIQLWICPVLFSPYTDLRLIRLVLNSPNLQFSYLIPYGISSSPVLNSPSVSVGEKGENKTGAKFSLYTVVPTNFIQDEISDVLHFDPAPPSGACDACEL